MANITKIKRDQMLAFLEELKTQHTDDASIRAFNEIENQLTEKKFGLVFEEHTEEVDEMLKENIPVLCADETRRLCKDETLPWNFIIEGDNLQALYLLEKTHHCRVDCIYIDPPYNTGATDWKYNNDYVGKEDAYRHSKWLSMMKSRLLLAKHLLNPENSVLICTIDEKEYLHLGCLLEELFPEASIQMISIIMNHAGTGRKTDFARINEFAYFVFLGEAIVLPEYEYGDEHVSVLWDVLRRSELSNLRQYTKSQFYPIFVNDKKGRIDSVGDPLPPEVSIASIKTPAGCTAVFPIREDGIETMWSCKKEELLKRIEKGYIRVGKKDDSKPQKYSLSYIKTGAIADIESGKAVVEGHCKDGSVKAFYQDKRKKNPPTIIESPLYDARTHGSAILDKLVGRERFSFPKSLYAVTDCLKFVIADKPNALVVDFFAGSGTTQHAVNLLNARDNGQRRYILVTNNELSVSEEKKLTEKGYKRGDAEWEALGIAKHVTWPRTVCSIEGHDINGKPLKGDYLVNDSDGNPIPMSQGFSANVKYFKCDWTPRKPENYLLSNALCLHIKEMIELQNAIEVDNVKNVLILNKKDFNKLILNPEIYAGIENIWINQNMILNADEMKLLKVKGFKYIPREFFGQELKEAAE